MYNKRLILLEYRNEYKQKEAAKLLGISESLYSRYKMNKKTIPIKHLNTLCNHYNVSLDYIFNLTDKINYENSKEEINLKLMAERLKEFRKYNNLTQERLANILDIGKGTVAEYERSNYIISTKNVYNICSKYHLSADYLLGKINTPKKLK